MHTEVVPMGDARAIEKAVHLLKTGGLVAFPTDTVYGVGASALIPEAVERIYRVKGRPRDKPIPLLLEGTESLTQVVRDIPAEAWRLMRRFWPGGLSLVLLRKAVVPDVVTGGGQTVAVRVPDHPFALELIRTLGGPLAATSANLTGQPEPRTAHEVTAYLEGHIELIVDGGRSPRGIPSTVVDLTSSPPVIIRAGAVPRHDLEQELGRSIA